MMPILDPWLLRGEADRLLSHRVVSSGSTFPGLGHILRSATYSSFCLFSSLSRRAKRSRLFDGLNPGTLHFRLARCGVHTHACEPPRSPSPRSIVRLF